MTIEPPTIFKWRHFQGKITKLCTRWYLRYGLSYQDLEETVAGYETMNMIRKRRVKGVKKGDILAQVELINHLCGIAA